MLGDGKRREAVMVMVCAVLGVIAILLFAIGIGTQSDTIGTIFARIGNALERPPAVPRPMATPSQQATPTSVPDTAEPPAPHGPVLKNSTTWITSDDYPAVALNRGMQGTVKIELRIDAIGRVADCVILHSSGAVILDEMTCRLARARALFYPARVSGEETLPSTWTRNVAWRIPDESGCTHDPAETCN